MKKSLYKCQYGSNKVKEVWCIPTWLCINAETLKTQKKKKKTEGGEEPLVVY